MAAIDTYLEQIENAIYGKDVRQAIHDGIQECYHDNADIVDVEGNNTFKNEGVLKVRNVDIGKYWDNQTGEKSTASTYCCSHELIKVDPTDIAGRTLVSENNEDMYVTCFGANKQFISFHRIFGKTARGNFSATPNFAIPQGTHYIGLSMQVSNVEELAVRMLDNVSVIEYPYDDPNLIYTKNKWRGDNGGYGNTTSLDCVVIPAVKEGDKYYTNARGDVLLQFFDSSNTAPLTAEVEEIRLGKIFTAPANTAYAVMNIVHAQYHGSGYANVVYKMTRNKSILAIGDSITWLDDISGDYDGGVTQFLGWQKQLERAGFKVVNYGFSGYTYAKDVVDGSTRIGSIYDKVVTDQYDVSRYDYIVLAGGTNDDLYAVPVGTVPNEYQHTYTNAELQTTMGALGAIIDYIRDNNPTCKIILCTQNKSQAVSRPYSEAVQYADGIRGMAKYASCYLCDLFKNMNVQPYTDSFAEFYYDTTHPNKAGMVRMGQLILKAIESA